MTICVKFWRGEWKKNEEEEWHFHPDENDVGKRVLIKADETYATLEAMVRREFSLRPSTPLVLTFRLPSWMLSPLGYKTPPTTITRTEDLCVLLNVQTSLSDLALIAIVGPRRVAEYEFLCRTRFSIGSTTYIVDGTQTEENRADYARLVFGDRAKETERVMNALFTEESIMLFHRVSCEMAYADQIGGNQLSNNQPSRDIIVVEDDDDDVMHDANNVNLETGENSNALGGTNPLPLPTSQAAAPSIFWDVGMDVRNYLNQSNTLIDQAAMANNMRFWEGVLAGGVEVDEQLNINDPAEVEMEVVGGVVSGAGGNDNAVGTTVSNEGVVKVVGEGEGGSSSTGSTKNVGSVFLNGAGSSGGLFSPLPVDRGILGVEGIHTSTGEIGIQVSTPRVLQVNPSQPNPPLPATPLFTFTQACQPGEPSGKRKVIKGDKETSSEASDIDGGF
ncbi:unnamed protein product [Brassica rapa]|uniref:Uncharacterized protein n=1 Tax=Brassica campestris TaxID=3711 RepID=A0A8D9MDR2_BRACM|nr:unnamed protein product [Brassica rapa]